MKPQLRSRLSEAIGRTKDVIGMHGRAQACETLKDDLRLVMGEIPDQMTVMDAFIIGKAWECAEWGGDSAIIYLQDMVED